MIYALDKPHLNLNEKEDSVEVTLNLPKVENGLDAFSGKIDYDQNKLELVKVKQVSKPLMNQLMQYALHLKLRKMLQGIQR